ncbi:MAG TPA: OB-fold nucleic acid binding domain-containing protein [Dehalococcoidales bacterium]|nr:OB-fold nucleic acid binding domain-containing protein [Dehalococcoidales bacterium]
MRKLHVGKKVELAGWVDRRRDHGELIFIDLRDRSGVAQVVFNPQISKEAHGLAEQSRSEFVLHVIGEVAPRPAGTENMKLPRVKLRLSSKKLKY